MDEDTNIQNNDVNEADETVTGDSSSSEETMSTEDSQAVEPTEGQVDTSNEKKHEDAIPYERFSKEVEKRTALEKKLSEVERKLQEFETKSQSQPDGLNQEQMAMREQAKEAFKQLADELGYVSKDELRRIEQDKQLDATLTALEKEFNGKNNPELKFNREEVIQYALDNGISNPRHAFMLMKQDAIMNDKIQNAIKGSRGLQTEGSTGTGSQGVGVSDDDLLSKMAKGDEAAKSLYLKRVAKKAFGGS